MSASLICLHLKKRILTKKQTDTNADILFDYIWEFYLNLPKNLPIFLLSLLEYIIDIFTSHHKCEVLLFMYVARF